MHHSILILLLYLFELSLVSSNNIYEYNVTLGKQIYIEGIYKKNIYKFYLKTNYSQVYKIQFSSDIIYNSFNFENEMVTIKEANEEKNDIYYKHIQKFNSENSLVNINENDELWKIEIFFTYYIRDINTKLLILEFSSINEYRIFLSLDIFLPEVYELSPNTNYLFNNTTVHNPYIFYLNGINKNQIININITTNKNKEECLIQEFDDMQLIERKKIFSYFSKKNIYGETIYNINYTYLKQSSNKTGLLYFLYDIYNDKNHFLNIKYNIIGEQFFFEGNNDTIKHLKQIEQNSLVYYWIKATKFQKIDIILKYSYFTQEQGKENPIKYIDIYEHKFQNISSGHNRYKKLEKEKFFPGYIVDSFDTNYILLEINPQKEIQNFEIEINKEGCVCEFNNTNKEKYIDNIKAYVPIYFYVNVKRDNRIFFDLTFDSKYIQPFNQINISHYKEKKDNSFIKSNCQEVKIKKINNNQSKIEFNYIHDSSKSELIIFKLESNVDMDYLLIEAEIGGGYYEINKNINNINFDKIIARGSVYYFSILATIFKKIDMNIIINNEINSEYNNNEPFSYVNIYEKEKINDNSFNKIYNQTFLSKLNGSKLNKYFSYIIDSFNTNYILLELKPNINIENVSININITNSLYDLSQG